MSLFFREYGEGKPIIIAHGLFGMSDNWIRIGKALSVKNKVYLLDIRNHGQSPHYKEHTYNAISSDFYSFLKEQNIEEATFIGHSMGGKAVLQFANNYPEMVKKMIIIDILHKEYKHDKVFLKTALNHTKLLKIITDSDISVFKTRKEIEDYFFNFFKDFFTLQLIQKNIYRNKQKKFSWKINTQVLYSDLQKMTNAINISKESKQIKTLFIFGNKSPYFQDKDKELIYNTFKNSEIKLIKDAGHLIHIEKEKELVKEISDFLKTN